MSTFLQWSREVLGRETAEDVASKNEILLEQLRKDRDAASYRFDQHQANAIRLTQQAQRMPLGSAIQKQTMASARSAQQQMENAAKQRDQLAGKVATLEETTLGLRGMDSNIQMTHALDRGNAVTARLASKVGVDKVQDVMDTAIEHKADHNEISDALSGKGFLDDVNEEDADASLLAMADAANADPTFGMPSSWNAYVPAAQAYAPQPQQYAPPPYNPQQYAPSAAQHQQQHSPLQAEYPPPQQQQQAYPRPGGFNNPYAPVPSQAQRYQMAMHEMAHEEAMANAINSMPAPPANNPIHVVSQRQPGQQAPPVFDPNVYNRK